MSPLNTSISYIFLLTNFLFLTSIDLFASAISPEVVCDQTRDRAFCTTVVTSDPRTKDAGLNELGQIIIDLASYNATAVKVKIHSLYISETNPDLKRRIGACDDAYFDALESLRDAADYLKRANYESVNIDAAAVSNDGLFCEDAFKHPPPFTSPFTKENYDIQQFAEIIAVIAKSLQII